MSSIICRTKPATTDVLLGSLALLRISALPNDHISTFVPFIATLLIHHDIYQISIDELIEKFSNEYGFVIPRFPMRAILNICIKNRIIVKQNDNLYYVQKSTAQKYCFTENVIKQSNNYNNFVLGFIEYCKLNNKIYTKNEAEGFIITFLNDNSCKTLSLNLDDFNASPDVRKTPFFWLQSLLDIVMKVNLNCLK